ncbi:MAG: aminoacetone oxidase family FAD-binding enzyme [Pseudomonadota bacterium]
MYVHCVILGAGAAGMMCAAALGRDALVVDHAKNPGEKIRISGGGRCNFTNLGVVPERFISRNPHFAKSALARYTQWDFIELVDSYGIAWHEKTLGQLFCDGKSTQIVEMLKSEMGSAALWLQTSLRELRKTEDGYELRFEREGKEVTVTCASLVVATGGKSIPKMGATGLAYDIAAKFDLPIAETRPALVPFTFPDGRFADISGVSTQVRAANERATFEEAMLFTHRGLSGPAMLQISSYWREGEEIIIDLTHETDLAGRLRAARTDHGKRQLATALADVLPARLVDHLAKELPLGDRLGDMSDRRVDEVAEWLSQWRLKPGATEGYRTAEVTLGGVETDALSSKTLEARAVPGLYIIGEAVDVTGWLGGYNFQWAWASGHAAGVAISEKLRAAA